MPGGAWVRKRSELGAIFGPQEDEVDLLHLCRRLQDGKPRRDVEGRVGIDKDADSPRRSVSSREVLGVRSADYANGSQQVIRDACVDRQSVTQLERSRRARECRPRFHRQQRTIIRNAQIRPTAASCSEDRHEGIKRGQGLWLGSTLDHQVVGEANYQIEPGVRSEAAAMHRRHKHHRENRHAVIGQ